VKLKKKNKVLKIENQKIAPECLLYANMLSSEQEKGEKLKQKISELEIQVREQAEYINTLLAALG